MSQEIEGRKVNRKASTLDTGLKEFAASVLQRFNSLSEKWNS